MPSKPKKQDQQPTSDERELAPHDRVTQQLVRQLKPHLPITSVETVTRKVREIEIEHHRLPSKLFAPFISGDLFPIETVEDLEQKLGDGVRRAVALARSGFIRVGNPLIIEVLSTVFQEPQRPAESPGPTRTIFTYDPTPTPSSMAGASLQDNGGK